jgi:uncharacterized membrane protein
MKLSLPHARHHPQPHPGRPHLSLAIALGAVVGLLLPHDWPLVTRLLIAWNIGVWSIWR